MINKDQMVNGIIRYLDNEVMPMLNTAGKWIVGSYVVLMRNNAEMVLDELMKNPLIKATGAVHDNGMIDIDMLAEALKESANKYGKLTMSIPIVGELGFNQTDVDMLKMYISGMR